MYECSPPIRRRNLLDGESRSKVNLMVQYSPGIDDTFGALADPTRRSILLSLRDGRASISDLAEPVGITLTGMKKHIQILETAQLVTTTKIGRTRYCELGPRQLDDIQTWIEEYREGWQDRFKRLDAVIAKRKESRS